MHHSHYCQVSQKYRFVHSDLNLLDAPASTNHIHHRPTIESSNCYRQTIRNSSNLSVVDPPVVIACAADEQRVTNYNDFSVYVSNELVSKEHLRHIEITIESIVRDHHCRSKFFGEEKLNRMNMSR